MAKVFLVTQGSYSDYGVVAVFDSRELAEAMVSGRREPEYYDIEEYELNPGAARRADGFSMWFVKMRQDGSTLQVEDWGFAWEEDEKEASLAIETAYADAGHRRTTTVVVGVAMEARVWARERQQAVKIVNERRAQWIADGRWAQEAGRLRHIFRNWQWREPAAK